MNIGDLLVRNANKFPHKLALVSETRSVTFRELYDRVNRLANSLLDSGLRKGDRIGVLVHNGHQFLEVYFASAKTGGIFCPYNNHFKQRELKDILDYSTPRCLIADRDFVDMMSELKPEDRVLDGSEKSLARLGSCGKPVINYEDDLIISGGVNVYPREIEEVLYRHPAVSEASVIGLPDEHWGEVVKAVIVPKKGVAVTEGEIVEFCGRNLAGFKKPKSVDFWTELPKSPQGKILKKDIRKHYGA
jgi:acyl-CoA synthetase (AMP-forming)/AMP-acid ligase II